MKKYKKIVVLDSVIFYPEHKERLNEIAEDVIEYNTCDSIDDVLSRVQGADCIISCWVDVPNIVIDQNPQLKTIAFWTHAFEHRIDKRYAQARGIYVPCIPDYGTDSVAELVFIGLLQLYGNKEIFFNETAKDVGRGLYEEIMARATDDVRKFHKNWRDNLRGSWIHEYIKAGQLKITNPDQFKEDTLKGLTLGLLVNDELKENLFKVASQGFRINTIYSLSDLSHTLDMAYRPIDNLLRESHIIVYDSRVISDSVKKNIKQSKYLSLIDVAGFKPKGHSLTNRKLGIIGLGRIGQRVAQIAQNGFNMQVAYFSKTRKLDAEKQYGLIYKSLQDILTDSDILSFHLPHIGAEGFITNAMIDEIPKGKTVINVSVGSIFENEDYFLNRFKEGDLNGYVDVYHTLPPREELRDRRKNLIATYRLGWRTKSTIGLKTHKLITRLKEGLDLI